MARHPKRRGGVRPRLFALAMVLLLAAGQTAGCAHQNAEGEGGGDTLWADTEIMMAAGAILSVLAAGIAASQEGD